MGQHLQKLLEYKGTDYKAIRVLGQNVFMQLAIH